MCDTHVCAGIASLQKRCSTGKRFRVVDPNDASGPPIADEGQVQEYSHIFVQADEGSDDAAASFDVLAVSQL